MYGHQIPIPENIFYFILFCLPALSSPRYCNEALKNGNDGFLKKTQQVINEDTFSLTPVLELPASGHPSYAAKVKTFEGKGIAVSSTSVILRPSSPPRSNLRPPLQRPPNATPPPSPPKKLIVTKEQEMKGKGTDHRESYAGGEGGGSTTPSFLLCILPTALGLLFVPIAKPPRRRLAKDPVASGFYYTHTLNCLLFH